MSFCPTLCALTKLLNGYSHVVHFSLMFPLVFAGVPWVFGCKASKLQSFRSSEPTPKNSPIDDANESPAGERKRGEKMGEIFSVDRCVMKHVTKKMLMNSL